MTVVLTQDLQRSIVHGCIVPPVRNALTEPFAHVDHAFLTKKLWQRASAPTFLRPCFFAVPALGPRARVRDLVLFGDEFIQLEEHFGAFLDELESVLRELRWSRVYASLHGQRSGTHTFTWRAGARPDAPYVGDDGPTQTWDFEGPRSIPLLHAGPGRPRE